MKRSLTRFYSLSIAIGTLTALATTGCGDKHTGPAHFSPPSGTTGTSKSAPTSLHDPSFDGLSADEANLANLGFMMKKVSDGQGLPYYEQDANPIYRKPNVKTEDLISALERYEQDLRGYIQSRPTDPSITDLKAKLDCVQGVLLKLTGTAGAPGAGSSGSGGATPAAGAAPTGGAGSVPGAAKGGTGGTPGGDSGTLPPVVGTTPTIPQQPPTSWGPTTPATPPCMASDGCPKGGIRQGAPGAGQGKGTSGEISRSLDLSNVQAAETALNQVGLSFELSNGDWGFSSGEYRQYAASHPHWRSEWLAALRNYQLSASDYLRKYGDLTTRRDTEIRNKLDECENTISSLAQMGSGS